MSVESDIFNALKALVGNRVYPDIAPNGAAHPYITYQQVGGRVINYTTNETPNRKHGRFQFNVWADSRAEASALALQIDDALRAASAFSAQPIGAPVSRYEPETQSYGAMQDFSLWSDR